MRVTGGEVQGRKLKAPKGLTTRPTTDKTKQAIFNRLQLAEFGDALDLFAGSGSIGIEFLSRGANSVVFVDGDANSIKIIKENLSLINLGEKASVYKNDVLKAIGVLGRKSKRFDYIFLDPPYEKGLVEKSLQAIFENGLLKEDGVIIAEHEKFLDLSEKNVEFKIDVAKRYGDTVITYLKHEED